MRLQLLWVVSCSLTLRTLLADVRIVADTPAKRVDCQTPGQLNVTGSLLEVGKKSFVLNLCLPTQDCATIVRASFTAEAPGLQDFSRYLKAPAYVQVMTIVEKRPDVCAQFISVANVAFWTGAPDPSGRGNRPYFAVADHQTRVNGSWFIVEQCAAGRGTLGVRIDQTQLILNLSGQASGSRDWSGRLLTAGPCDSQQGWSFWIASTLRDN